MLKLLNILIEITQWIPYAYKIHKDIIKKKVYMHKGENYTRWFQF